MAVPPALYAAGALDWGEFLHYFTAPSGDRARHARPPRGQTIRTTTNRPDSKGALAWLSPGAAARSAARSARRVATAASGNAKT